MVFTWSEGVPFSGWYGMTVVRYLYCCEGTCCCPPEAAAEDAVMSRDLREDLDDEVASVPAALLRLCKYGKYDCFPSAPKYTINI